jgi:hypothetical protein
MAPLNPLNNTLAEELASTRTQLANLQNARQPYISDWIEITEAYTRTSASVITIDIAGLDLRDIFQFGDKFRLKQGGDYKYFYVISVTELTLTLNAGDDYTLAVGAVTDLAYSRVSNPLGHPGVFTYTPSLRANGAMTIAFLSPSTNRTLQYNINGMNILLFDDLSLSVGGTPNTDVFIGLPFSLADTSNQVNLVIRTVQGLSFAGNIGFMVHNSTTTELLIYRPDGANWTAGNLLVSIAYTYVL